MTVLKNLNPIATMNAPNRTQPVPDERVITISSFPNPFPGNPYLSLLYEHLDKQGVRYVSSGHFGQEWLRAHRKQVDVLHFHWIAGFVGKPAGVSFARLVAFLAKLQLARALGYKMVWTAHNLFPHDYPRGFATWLARFLFVHSVDAIFVTFPAAVSDLDLVFWRRRRVYVVPHGNYHPTYPERPGRSEARRRLGLGADSFLFFVFGGIRPYKGADKAIAAVLRCDVPGVSLVVLGQCLDSDYQRQLEFLAKGDARVKLLLGRDDIPDDEVCLWMSAIDCLVAPYEDVYTSGTLYLAATFGKPVIAPRVGVFAGLGDEAFLFLYHRDSVSDELPILMEKVVRSCPERLSEAAHAFADRHEWSAIAGILAGHLREIVRQ